MLQDFFQAESLITARLESIGELLIVKSAMDMDTLKNQIHQKVGATIIYAGYRPRSGSGCSVAIEQRWLVALAVKHAADQTRGDKLRARAGPVIICTMAKLLGHKLSEDFSPLELMAGIDPFYRPGFAFFPFIFKTSITLQGEP